jgi:hypothetical protein
MGDPQVTKPSTPQNENHPMIFWKLPLYCLILLLPVIFQTPGSAFPAPEPTVSQGYPLLINEIDRSQADFKTPENTAAASLSALLKRDIDWYFQTMTVETAAQEKKMFQDAGIPLSKIFDLMSPSDEVRVTGTIPYKDGLVLTFEKRCHDIDGTIIKTHSGYIRENGLWKKTNRFSGDENLDQYDDVIYTSCIAAYRFGPDFLEDSCWHGNDLTNYNDTKIAVDQRYDEDLTVAVFNGIDNGLALEHLNSMPVERLSMGGWIKADQIAPSAGIIEIGRDWNDSTAIVLDPGKGLRYQIHAGGKLVLGNAARDEDLHTNQWHHVYLTYDGARVKLYVDGKLKDSKPATGPIDSAPVLHIGQRNATDNAAVDFFKGRLDDIQIYNRALTADEVRKKYKNGTTQSL